MATLAVATASADELAPYRSLVGSAEGARLLAAARAEMSSIPSATPDSVPDWPGPPTAVYMSLLRVTTTRACVGTDTPIGGSLEETVRALAREVLRADRRRPPVRPEEIQGLRIVIAFAGAGTAVRDPMFVDPAREGLLVTTSRGSVAFLPGEARTVAWALREARRVGVLSGPTREASFRRFPVVALAEPTAAPNRRPRTTEPSSEESHESR